MFLQKRRPEQFIPWNKGKLVGHKQPGLEKARSEKHLPKKDKNVQKYFESLQIMGNHQTI